VLRSSPAFVAICLTFSCGSDVAQVTSALAQQTDGGPGAGGGNVGVGGSASTGGHTGVGGSTSTGGNAGRGGNVSTGGKSGTGGVSSGGVTGNAGRPATGGTVGTGGGSATGGVTATGGTVATGGAPSGGSASYSTNFDLTESPISESGHWHHSDPNQSIVVTASGLAYGSQNGTGKNAAGGYDDSIAFLDGFPPNQRMTCVLHRTGSQPGYLEAEIWLRASEGTERASQFGATRTYGYEINIEGNGEYIQIGQFKGLPSLFDSHSAGSPLTSMGVHDGDVFEADIIGNAITVRLNGTVIASASDTGQTGSGAIATGNPGIGFFRQDVSVKIDPTSFCFTSCTAESL